jgi:hypothetical protein
MDFVRRADHVVSAGIHGEAMFRYLTEECGLPVAWPFQDYGGYVSGGVGCGNLNLEFVQRTATNDPSSPARFTGLALEPHGVLEDRTLIDLDQLGLGHGDLVPTPGWTTLELLGLSQHVDVFFCDYRIPGARDDEVRAELLRSVDGGRFHVVRAKNLFICSDDATSEESWSRLLGPSDSRDRPQWSFANGPSISLSRQDDATIAVELELESADDVASWLRIRREVDPMHGLALHFVARS